MYTRTHTHTYTHTRTPTQVTLVPRSGLLGQLVVFDFGSFIMIRGLAVHVLTEQESRMLDTVALKKKKAKKKLYAFMMMYT